MKLLQYQKDAIKKKVLAEKFDPQFATLEAKENAFANRLLDAVKRISELDTLPEGWAYEGASLRVYFNGYSVYLSLGAERRQPYGIPHRGSLSFSTEDPETAEFTALKHERDILKLAKAELGAEIDKVLRAVSTDKRLLEVWPEAEKYLPKVPPPVPAVVDATALRNLLAT